MAENGLRVLILMFSPLESRKRWISIREPSTLSVNNMLKAGLPKKGPILGFAGKSFSDEFPLKAGRGF
jgi:hypothetical protein